jgi:sarcosine oxidase
VKPEPAEVVTCRYTETADRDFIIDRHPEHPNMVLASPCSGHGFKFSILTGRLAEELSLGSAPAEELENWRSQFALEKTGTSPEPLAREWRD